MALSKEYTYWHLTPNGWFSGDSKTDFNSWSVDAPIDTVLTIKYEEKVSHSMSGLETSIERYNEIEDKSLVKNLELKFPFKGYIKVYE
ncbi:hypothetical protein [Flavobacterium macrobrachii]|uniref:Uncharacterized protein n=1 Tax=Flavobacterium macrobrachii TaxID=591204 RepID=A0ABS2CZ01_9FLAO|nr:hypothetical protein [Flavobacterium macrobrachii]MBM6500188.1 hypothetical protein [Flavobacterium macrobrachii]